MRFFLFALFALLLTLAPELGQAQDGATQTEDNSSSAANQTEDLPPPFRVQLVENDEQAIARERRESEAEQREIDDLIAQQGMNLATQSMNEATQKMVLYSYISTILVLVGTFGVLYSLHLARQANKFAWDAVQITEKIGHQQTRAYLCQAQHSVMSASTGGAGTPFDRFALSIPFENRGPSPALNAQFLTRDSRDSKFSKDTPVQDLEFTDRNYSIPPGSIPSGDTLLIFTPEEIIQTSTSPIMIRVSAKYEVIDRETPFYTDAVIVMTYTGTGGVALLRREGLDPKRLQFQILQSHMT